MASPRPADIARLQARLERASNARSKAFWTRYLKGALPFRGTPMGRIRKAVRTWRTEDLDATLSPARQKGLAFRLLAEPVAEDKLAGVLLLAEHLLGTLTLGDEPRFARAFDRGHVADWNTCDWLCVKVLGPWVETSATPEQVARRLAGWKTARTLWQRRAASVAFVHLAPRGEAALPGLPQLLLDVMRTTVKHPERFAQTGVGWVLRELARAEPGAVAGFVETHRAHLSREAVQTATKTLAESERRRLLDLHQDATRGRPRRWLRGLRPYTP